MSRQGMWIVLLLSLAMAFGLYLILHIMHQRLEEGILTTAPHANIEREIRMEKLKRIGNISATSTRPIWARAPYERFMTLCTMMRNEAKYVREWVEFHSLLGVDKFFIFDNDSKDSLEAALNKTIANVSIIQWPPVNWKEGNPHSRACQAFMDGTNLVEWALADCQLAAFHECVRNERGRSRWISTIYVDEFLLPRYDDEMQLQTLPEALAPYDHMHGVRLNSFTYGTSHYFVPIRDDELVIETHTIRGDELSCEKEIVDPSKVETYPSVHYARYLDPVWNIPWMRDVPRQHSTIRFNHYPLKSVQEAKHKGVKNLNPRILQEIHKWDKLVDIEDPYLIPMVPLVRRRLAGEHVWVQPRAKKLH